MPQIIKRRRTQVLQRIIAIIFWLALPLPCLAAAWTACPAGQSQARYYYQQQLVPGLTWDSWSVLLARKWNEADRARPGWLDMAAIIRSVNNNPVDTDYAPSESPVGRSFLPRTYASDAESKAYQDAAGLFYNGAFHDSVMAFDAIVATHTSPYAPAAAYSAARAAIDAGDFADGVARIGDIIADPTMQDMHQAAHHLIGTIASQTGAAPMVAARLTEITHLLMAPVDLRCRFTDLRILMDEADEDLNYLLRGAYATDRFFELQPWSQHTRHILWHLAPTDPVIDLIQVLAAPSPYGGIGPWIEPFFPKEMAYPNYRPDNQTTVADSDEKADWLTQHARARANEAANPLWAYALAIRTRSLADLPILRSAEAQIININIPNDQKEILHNLLVMHQARILLMAGKEDEALATAAGFTHAELWGMSIVPESTLAEGGRRYLLAKRDLAGARRWVDAPVWDTSALPQNIVTLQQKLRESLLLEQNWSEALAVADPRNEDYNSELASGLDLLSADQLVALSKIPKPTSNLHKTMISAAWVRYYIMGDKAKFRALMPQMRDLFPEMASDIDNVNRAWFPWTWRHRVTHLMLRFPGLSPRVSWARPVTALGRWWMRVSNNGSLLYIDSGNPSDGNWWCPADPLRFQRDFFAAAFSPLTMSFYENRSDPRSIEVLFGAQQPSAETIDNLVHDWLSWHPLFKDAALPELDRLSKVPSGPVQLGQEAIAWAKSSNWITRWLGFDEGLPETLALSVRATRYGCRRTGPLGQVSRDAWVELHRLFPKSEAASTTPYWYDEGPKP